MFKKSYVSFKKRNKEKYLKSKFIIFVPQPNSDSNVFVATVHRRIACILSPTAAVTAIWFLCVWWLVPFIDIASQMQNEACTVLFKYIHVGSPGQMA